MARVRKNFDEGIQLDLSTTPGTREGEIWLDANDNKAKIFLDGVVQEFTTSNANTAASVSYENNISGLNATNAQDAIDELLINLQYAIANIPVVYSLAIVDQPTDAGVDAIIAPPITVQLKDQHGEDIVGTNNILATLSGPGTLSGTTTVDAVLGVATFSDLQVSAEGTYTITFSSTGLTSTDPSDTFIVANAPAEITSLFITQQPTNTLEDTVITPPIIVQLKDQYGVNISGTNLITATLYKDGVPATVETLSGTLSVNADIVTGIAEFLDLQVDIPGDYTIVFSSTGLSNGVSNNFTVNENLIPTSIQINEVYDEIVDTTLGFVLLHEYSVRVLDQNLNPLTPTSPVTYSVSLYENGSPAIVATLSGTTVKTGVNNGNLNYGKVNFTDLTVDKLGTYTLNITNDIGLPAVTSELFDIVPSVSRPLFWTGSSAGGFTLSNNNRTIEFAFNGGLLYPHDNENYSSIKGGNGYVEFTYMANNAFALCAGLQNQYNYSVGASISSARQATEYGVYITQPSGTINSIRNDVQISTGSTIALNDIIKIEVVGTSVYIKKNESIIYTWTSQTISYPLGGVFSTTLTSDSQTSTVSDISIVNNI